MQFTTLVFAAVAGLASAQTVSSTYSYDASCPTDVPGSGGSYTYNSSNPFPLPLATVSGMPSGAPYGSGNSTSAPYGSTGASATATATSAIYTGAANSLNVGAAVVGGFAMLAAAL